LIDNAEYSLSSADALEGEELWTHE